MTSPRLLLVAATLSTFGAATFAETTVSQKDYQIPRCDKPVASVVIGKISCKANACQPPANQAVGGLAILAALAAQGGPVQAANFAGIGDGMGAMLTTVLKETNCFEIQEREAMDEVARELALVGKKVEVQQADFMISGSITSINMGTEKKSFGGGFIPIIGAISTTTVTADLGMDIKIIDVNKARLVESKTFMANNETSSYGLGAGGLVGGALIGGAMSSSKGTPMEPIIRDVLTRVASFSSNRLMTERGVAPLAVSPAPLQPPLATASAN